jgi:SpoVK/Ycf46/Vps4 family AAA+-type ATPase
MESNMSQEKEDQGKFKWLKATKLEDLIDGTAKEIPESDLTIQTDTHIVQMEYIDPEDTRRQTIIKPGCFSIEDTSAGIQLNKFELKHYELLETIDNTSVILSEVNKFYGKLDVYKKLGKDPKRALLMASPPGVGKTAAINKVCVNFLKDPGTTVIVWDTSDVRSSSVNKFFLNNSKFQKKVKKLILVMEDIGGGSTDGYEGPRGADSSLLNLLDGVGTPFQGIPTFILATTNNPENSVAALIDRPGRFDKVVTMKTPGVKECSALLEFIVKRESTEAEKAAAKLAAKNEFSIAHIQESLVRSMIDDISIMEATKQLVEHKKLFKKAFAVGGTMGLGKF